ncbi:MULTISPECIES: type II toxin-antitoxin system RelE/ParE family toxin [Agrobacterium]|uniref:type II toxin-antitoxin system RelE/ParE family toxin n=1 Tax=Agrobacterium TaxID=357 RepID=UPI0021D19417|nr:MULTISPECIES: type II toxin-antitoxin system RelE/ParE family toxin [Agrobacterium]UXS26934.1 type II toxin-antitoxin system RelE/ParE family toxin [Agrobacterium tumefaciens]UXS54567.1 type II toxin-antitoxin system RelE/ParE family toxin [Agrobacterium tumefaciens]UXS65460.1 type II toxin-antitoxin system RelE/ParE family toxin [Agrobacterium tumefaciens]WLD98839.1 type II toxin-antitoxin system RelE/ParE family toxin [Agrobacterium leguminum]
MKRYTVILHERAEAELLKLYGDLASYERAGPEVAWNYVSGIRSFLSELSTFPKRGTVREGKIPGLRIIGYRRSVSIAFAVEDNYVMVLGVFYGGQEIRDDVLEGRL